MLADFSSGKSRVVVWEYRECRVPVTAEFMSSAHCTSKDSCMEQGVCNRESLAALQILPASLSSTGHPVMPSPTLGAPSSLQPLSCSQKGRGTAEAILQEAWLGCLWTLLLPCESRRRCQGSCWWHRRRFVPALWGYYGNWGEGEQTNGAESQPARGDCRAPCRGVAGSCWGGCVWSRDRSEFQRRSWR